MRNFHWLRGSDTPNVIPAERGASQSAEHVAPMIDSVSKSVVSGFSLRLSEFRFRVLIACCWLAVGASALVLVRTDVSTWGWDAHVYANAMRSLACGHDPYADGVAVQRTFHETAAAHDPGVMPPYTYVYSPLTLPMLRAASLLPFTLAGMGYFLLYAVAVVAMAWALLQPAEPAERRFLAFFATMSPFFPGLLQTNVVLSGNVVYLLYAAVLCCAVLGWQRGRWLPFYAAVFVASCFKAPLLTLLLIPVLSARRQWTSAAITAALGVLAFAVQPLLWPVMFHHYLEAVGLQFEFNHDFGFSPSGLLGAALDARGLPYTGLSTAFYGLYAAVLLASLLWMARAFFRGEISLTRWIPVLLTGVVLLNPRIKEYDVALLSLPMAMIVGRMLPRGRNAWSRALLFVAVLLVLNLLTLDAADLWKPAEGVLMIVVYAAGCRQLLHARVIMADTRSFRLSEPGRASAPA